MEEKDQTNYTAEVTSEKKDGKTKKLIIAILAVIMVTAIVIGILLATGILELQLSKKSKMIAGVEKLGEMLIKPTENLSASKENTIKITNNISKDSPIGISEEISANIDNANIKELSSSENKKIEEVINLINKSKIKIEAKNDGEQKTYVNLNANIEDTNLSAEAIYDGEQGNIRSKEINPKWLTFSKEDLELMLKEENIDIEDINEQIDTIVEQIKELSKSTEVDEKTQKEIEDRYKKVLKDFINEKAKKIESERDKVEVNGKSKNCEKLTLNLEENDIKELLNKYIDTLKNDTQLQKLLKETLKSYIKILENTTQEIESLNMPSEEDIDELILELDNLKKQIEDMKFDGKIIITVYATNTEVYKTDISIKTNETEIILETTFNKDKTSIQISAKSSGVSLDIAKITIKTEENKSNIKIETSKAIEEYIRQKISLEINCKKEKTNKEIEIILEAGSYGKGNIKINTDTTKDEEKEYEGIAKVIADIDIPSIITLKGNLEIKSAINTQEVTIPNIQEEKINANNEEQLAKYLEESEENITSITGKLMKNELLKSIIEDSSQMENENTLDQLEQQLKQMENEDTLNQLEQYLNQMEN